MAFRHKALALDGVGFGHKVLAILGTRWFDVEIIVTPPFVTGGGGYNYGPPIYTIKFVVTLKSGKVITTEHKYTKLGLETLEKVVATFKSARKVFDFITLQVSNINRYIHKIIVKVKP
jgi:hypothetical protein